MKFGKHIHLNIPKLVQFTDDVENTTVFETNKFAIYLVEKIEDEICEQISKMAIDNGIDDVYVIDKGAVLSALKKQMPKKVELFNGQVSCPNCKSLFGNYADLNKIHFDSPHCQYCGQALDWSDIKLQ